MSQLAAQDQTLTTEEVRVEVHHKHNCKVELHVKTSQELVRAARKNAVKAVSKEVALPGFRKGKAPEEIILKKFPNDVERALNKAIADLAFVAAQKVAKVPLLNNNSQISFDMKSQSVEDGAELYFSFETEPVVPKVEKGGFTPKPVERAEVGEKQIEEAIRQMRFFYAQWTPVHDRPIQDGDYIMINLDTVEGDVVTQVFNHIRFEVSKDRMASWMKKLVAGAKSGDVLEGISEPDDTATEAEKAEFKPKNVRLSILKVEEAVLPEVDDEFAKKVGATDAAHMRQSITDLLNKQADEKVQTELREQVNDYLVNQYPFDLPQSLVNTEKKHRLNQLMQDPKFKAKWDKMSQEERKKIDADLDLESNQAVRIFYLSRQVVQNEKIPVTQQEVQLEAIAIYQSHGYKNVELDKMSKEVYALALSKVILGKAQDFVLEPETDKKA